MIVATTESNVIDQRGLEEQLWRGHRVPMLRMPLAQVRATGVLMTSDCL
jgi:hypothetical protein